MALIFYVSAQPQVGPELGVFDLLLRKLAHMVEYGLLWLLWWRALDRRAAPAAGISFLYACSDELHQTFVDGRHGTPVDVLIDSAGIAIAWIATWKWQHRRGGPSGPPYSQPRSVA